MQLRSLVKAIDLVAKNRSGELVLNFIFLIPCSRVCLTYTEVAAATGEFAQTVADLAASDIGQQLSGGLAGLADVERVAQDFQNTQSQEDIVTIMSTGEAQSRLNSD